MARDYIEEARRRQEEMLRSSSYFPAANLRQFEGTELAPPGGGTYYKPSRYAGAPPSVQRSAQRNLANAYQQDLAFNVQANPQMAAGLQAERIGSQYRGRGTFAGRPGYTTIYTPEGGSAVVSQKVADRMAGKGGYSLTNPNVAIQQQGYAQGYGTTPSYQPDTGTISSGGVERPIEQATAAQRFQYGVPSFGQRLGENPFGVIGGLAYNALNSVVNLFRGNQRPSQPPVSQSYVNQPYRRNNPREPYHYFDF